MFHAGLDLSRKRLDFCLLDESGERVEVGAAPPDADGLRSPGKVVLVRLDASTSFSLGGTSGTARVVWKTPHSLTVVQCVRVRRGGSVLHGLSVILESLSHPIGHQSACPSAG